MDSQTTTEPGASESERQFAPARGYPALAWNAQPTRAGWWVAWNGWSPTVYFVTVGLKAREGLHIYHDGFWREPSEIVAVGWAGPFESPQPPTAETPDNAEVSDECPPRASAKEKP